MQSQQNDAMSRDIVRKGTLCRNNWVEWARLNEPGLSGPRLSGPRLSLTRFGWLRLF